MIGISPLVDFAFKAILGSPEHLRVTVHFLNALLAPPRITEVRILNPFLGQETDGDKLAVLHSDAPGFSDTGGVKFTPLLPADIREFWGIPIAG